MILVTGASGFIGSHLLGPLSRLDKVRCLVRPHSKTCVTKFPSVEIFEGDMRSAVDLRTACSGASRVIHLAALLRKSSPEEMRRVNVEGTRWLIEAAKKNGASHFIFVSSENALREDLDDPYAQTKREAEVFVRTFEHSLILRPCFIYGKGDDHGLGRLLALAMKSPVVPLLGGLENKIQPLYIDDMVQYLLLAVKREITGEYVLAGPREISLNDFLRRACETHGKKRLFLPVPRSFLRAAAGLGDAFGPSFGWGHAQWRNLYYSRTYPISETVKAFDYAPRPFDETMVSWAGLYNKSPLR